jgi:site-specific DNA-methyltransferase (adenine-specific)
VNSSNEKAKHPTQKPLELMRYLINTYSNKGDTILDFTMGSGSTMVACVETKRDGIGIELDETYYNLAKKRVGEKRKEKEIEAQTLFNEQN